MELVIHESIRKWNEKWAVYIVIQNNAVIYIGKTPLLDIMKLLDAHNNSEFAKMMEKDDDIFMRLEAILNSETIAYRVREKLVQQYQPVCNLRGHSIREHQRVKCVETGEEFENAAAACKKYRLSQPNMSNHLRGIPGHKTLKGYTFTKF